MARRRGKLGTIGASCPVPLRRRNCDASRQQASGDWSPWCVADRIGRKAVTDNREFSGNFPRAVHLTSSDGRRFDLQLTLSQVEVNVPLEDSVFHPDVPSSYTPLRSRHSVPQDRSRNRHRD